MVSSSRVLRKFFIYGIASKCRHSCRISEEREARKLRSDFKAGCLKMVSHSAFFFCLDLTNFFGFTIGAGGLSIVRLENTSSNSDSDNITVVSGVEKYFVEEISGLVGKGLRGKRSGEDETSSSEEMRNTTGFLNGFEILRKLSDSELLCLSWQDGFSLVDNFSPRDFVIHGESKLSPSIESDDFCDDSLIVLNLTGGDCPVVLNSNGDNFLDVSNLIFCWADDKKEHT